VTTTIQACAIPFKQDDGRIDSITICDTPGFGDTKGVCQEIANGLGIIHALKGAASIKPVLVLDFSGMATSRWSPLRKTLDTVIAMIGRESIDFSPFSYVFTRCEGKNKNRISKQLSGFQNVVRDDPDIEDKAVLDLLLTDMICKTKPGEAVCIDPEEPDDAPDTLKRILGGCRINDPADRFVNFCSRESMATLAVQVGILIHNFDMSLQAANMDSAEVYLHKMIGLAKALSLPELDQDVKKGIVKAKLFVSQLTSSIETLATRIFSDSEFDETLDVLSSNLILLSKSANICNVCEMDFNCCSFINGITERLFSTVRQHISGVDPTALQGAKYLQQLMIRFDSLATSLQGLMESEAIQSESSTMIDAIKNVMEPVFVILEDSLVASDPTATTLNENLDKVNFVLAMNDFLGSSELSTLNQELSDWILFQSGLNNVLNNISEKSQICVTDLAGLDNTLHEELLEVKVWSYASLLKLNNSTEHKECRDFLQAVSSSESLFSSIEEDPTKDIELMIREYGEYIIKYSQKAVDFLQRNSQNVLDNDTVDTAGRVKEAGKIAESVDIFLEAANNLEELDPAHFQKVWKNLEGMKGRLEQFIEDYKKNLNRRHSIVRGELLEPSEEELARTPNKQDKRNLFRWYKRCNELGVYRMKHNGNCNVPRKDPRLGEVS
jgi:tetratricopeptide (TPR) repeat protein